MNPIFLEIGSLKIYWYSIAILFAFIIGCLVIMKETNKFSIDKNYITNLLFFAIPISIIGARLYYVIFNWSYYSQNLIDIVKIWEGGLAIHGGIIAGLIWVIIYTKKYKVDTYRIIDILVVGLIIGQAIGRWGNFFNGEAHGSVVTLEFLKNIHIPQFIINGIYINGNYYHPTFLYESLWCLIGFIVLLFIRRIKYIKVGQITGVYLCWYGLGRFLIESLRTDSLMFYGIKQAQIISALMTLLGIVLLIKKGLGSKFKHRYNDKGEINEIRF